MRRFFMIAFILLGGVNLFGQTPVNLIVGIDDPTTLNPGHPKAPPYIPLVEQDGSVLYFELAHADYTLELIQDDEVIYSVVVPASTTTVVLPSWIEGECEIRLLTGGIYYFYGYITL